VGALTEEERKRERKEGYSKVSKTGSGSERVTAMESQEQGR
jgi:hypothetical protein